MICSVMYIILLISLQVIVELILNASGKEICGGGKAMVLIVVFFTRSN